MSTSTLVTIAYLDPGSAAIAIQVLIATVAGVGFAFSRTLLAPFRVVYRVVKGRGDKCDADETVESTSTPQP